MSTATPTITIEAEGVTSRDRQLEQAIDLLRDKTTHCGILVTRLNFTTYTAALSFDVEYGLIQELDLL
ncbi:hypothetical protein [Arthrobacter sp. ISL-65]|uniref:hypothetical protein n=1 Tax=Arthrobacter sp. ISL-65 TaxID=2819112 RepID=UPI001BEB06B2|nr:hypothetical protein [Arthrobacter sp. ISL-65]MBT2547843.1 hypothetical protein [Arthrobacter sp. ISL-65]